MKGLYIHIPFCSVKCFYCDFVAFSGQGHYVWRYLHALRREMERNRDFSPDTLYIGGGTPTELASEQLVFLLSSIKDVFGFPGNFLESTLEANPESLTSEKLEVLRSFGIGRLSLGLQSVQDNLLARLGRRHNYSQFREAFSKAREAGFSNINVDLMFGLEGQTVNDLRQSLAAVCGLGPARPEHISTYDLQVEPRTLFFKKKVFSDESVSRQMYGEIISRLTDAGYNHYEISNFALPGFESKHNRIYWENGEYLGLGCGAASHQEGVRRKNLDRLEDYCGAVERGEEPVASAERLEGREKIGEDILLGLRLLEGIEIDSGMRREFHGCFNNLQETGLLEVSEGSARLTAEGIFLANRVFEEFVPPFGEQ